MALAWYRQDKEAVVAALRRGERPDLATTMSSGPLDELVALHDEVGVFSALDAVELARERAGSADRLLLADALYADGPLLAWLKYQWGSDVLVPLPADRLLYADLAGLAATGRLAWTTHRYTVTLQGHKQLRTVPCAAADDLTSWDSYLAAAVGHPHSGAAHAGAGGGGPLGAGQHAGLARWLRRPPGLPPPLAQRERCLSHTQGGLEAQRWGRDLVAALGRLTLTCLACNTAQISRSRAGALVATLASRRLRRHYQPQLGSSPAVIFLGDAYAVLSLEDLLDALGAAAHASLLPAPRPKPPG